MTKTRQITLSVLVLALLAIKFVVIPVIDWQEDRSTQLALAEKRLERGMSAIENITEYESLLEKTQKQIRDIEKMLFPYQPETLFRLEQQSWLENLISEYEIESESISWSPAVTFGGINSSIMQHKLDVTLIGDVDDMVRLHAALELGERAIVLENFNWVIDRHLAKNVGTARGTATLVLYSQSVDEESRNSGEQQ